MGWIYFQRAANQSVDQTMREELEQQLDPGRFHGFTILEAAITGTTYWAILLKTHHTTGAQEKICLCALTHHTHAQFGYKVMHEASGPFEIPPQSFFTSLEQHIPLAPKPFGERFRARCRQAYSPTQHCSGTSYASADGLSHQGRL